MNSMRKRKTIEDLSRRKTKGMKTREANEEHPPASARNGEGEKGGETTRTKGF